MKKIFNILFILCFMVGVLAECNSKIKTNNKTTETVTIDKSSLESYSKTLVKAMKISVDINTPLDSKTDNDLQEYLSKYYGENFYDDEFRKNYTEKQLILIDDVELSALSLKDYFREKSKVEESEKSMKIDKTTIINTYKASH